MAVSVALAGVTVIWHSTRRQAWIEGSIPARPELAGWPAALQDRITACEERIQARKDAVVALGELAGLYHANGFHSEAARCYQALLDLAPREPRWPHRLAHVLAGFGRVEDAVPLWRRTVELAPGYVPARLRLGDALLKGNEVVEAADAYRGVLAIEPRNPYALLGLARIDVEGERWAEARNRLETVVRLSDYSLGYDILPTVCEKLGDEKRAQELRGRAKASGAYRDVADPWVDELALVCFDLYRLLLMAGAAAGANDHVTAERLFERAGRLFPDEASIHYQVGVYLVNRREFTRAKTHLERSVELAPTFADGWAWLAFVRSTVGDTAGADLALNRGLEHCPHSPGLHLDRGRRRAAAGLHDEAIADFKESSRLRPEDPDAYIELARELLQAGRAKEGAAALREAVRVEPGHAFALMQLAIQAIMEDDEVEASAWIRQIQAQPRVPPENREAVLQAFRQRFGHGPEQ